MTIGEKKVVIRKYMLSDCKYIAELFYQTVHAVNARDYTKEQLDVWADGKADLVKWDDSFCEHETVVALIDDVIVGFGDIDKSGYLDRLYVHKDYQRQGIASAICDELEGAVEADAITTHASITAKPFFERRGFKIIKKQQIVRDGISLVNYIMEKGGRHKAGTAKRGYMRIVEVEERLPLLMGQLLDVWEGSVRETHLFLSNDEIESIKKYVPQALGTVPHLVIAENEDGLPVAFMGIDGQKIEMLFVAPGERGNGLGKILLRYGIEKYGVHELAVNEQNPSAKGFYEHMGFHVFRRTDYDEQGKPYPLLYMELG